MSHEVSRREESNTFRIFVKMELRILPRWMRTTFASRRRERRWLRQVRNTFRFFGKMCPRGFAYATCAQASPHEDRKVLLSYLRETSCDIYPTTFSRKTPFRRRTERCARQSRPNPILRLPSPCSRALSEVERGQRLCVPNAGKASWSDLHE